MGKHRGSLRCFPMVQQERESKVNTLETEFAVAYGALFIGIAGFLVSQIVGGIVGLIRDEIALRREWKRGAR